MKGLNFDTYVTKPIQVRAIQFRGWANAQQIAVCLPDELRAFFVPRGYEHADRRDNEKDSSRGDVLRDAPEYLMLALNGVYQRYDVGCWLVCGLDGVWDVVSDEDFKKLYAETEKV